MSTDYRRMWTELGMDLKAHDALLDALNQGYRDIYLSQKNRPQGMRYFDFVLGQVHGQRIQELREEQQAGRKIIGSYCVFVPEEIVLAGNATLVGLCSGADFAMEEVEKVLPRNTLCDELEQRGKNKEGVRPQGTPRILMSGCPMAVPNWKMPHLVESAGGLIVGEESCVGERGNRNLVDDSGQTVDELIEALVNRYFQIECAIFTPNPDRLERIKKMYSDSKADGVIHYSIQFCQPYIMESIPVEKALEAEGIPCLRVETDYSMEDAGQLSTRIEAFLEVLR